LSSSSLACPPRWGTPRNPDRLTHGPRVGLISEALGKPLMPWQQHVADVALEVDPETGLLAYRTVILTIPRQSGKTTLMLAVMVHRALGFQYRNVITYWAQTRMAARKKWEDEHLRLLDGSPFRQLYEVRKTNGQEAIKWSNGSLHGIEANTESAGHGDTLDLGMLDEAFRQVDNRVEQAARPAMLTRPEPQFWIVSTAGTADSTFLWSKVELGRSIVDIGADSKVACFEWSAPDDLDPLDPATWATCMPALGHTVSEESIRADAETMPLGEFERAYLNRWSALRRDPIIPSADWIACHHPKSKIQGRPAFAYDVNPERSWAAIAVSDGKHHEVIDHRAGTSWVPSRLKELEERHRPSSIATEVAAPGGSLIPEIRDLGVEITEMTGRDAAAACGQFYDRSIDHELRHIGQPELDQALAGAAKRRHGDSWKWDRSDSSVDICPLVAVTDAGWAASSAPAKKTKPIYAY
jgi:hypothetical protein